MVKGAHKPANVVAAKPQSSLTTNGTTTTMKAVTSSCLPRGPCGGYSESSLSLPTIIVFDLDDCLWTPEMHELSGMPSIPVEGPLDPNDPEESTLGIIGMKVPSQKNSSRWRGGGFDWGGHSNDEEIVELYPGARLVLREIAMNPIYKHVQLAVASTSLEPSYSMTCIDGIDGIEIMEGVSLRSMLSYVQVGREGKLSTRKTNHFQLIQEESGGVPYAEMLFFGKDSRM